MAYINDMKTEEYIDSKCPNCGSTLVFVAGSRQTQCVSCDSTFDIESLGTGKLDHLETNYAETVSKLVNQNQKVAFQRVIHCEDCGGLINLNPHTISTECPFCGSKRVVEENKEEEIINIAGIIPFIITEKEVKENYKKWIKRKMFAPSKLKKGKISPKYSGVYIPFYTFDSETFSKYTAWRGDYYYTYRTVKTKNGTRTERVRHTRWTFRSGNININFDDLLIVGTNNPLNNYIRKIDDFNFTTMEVYQEQFMLGYYAEKPSISLENGFSNAKEEMKRQIRNACVRDIGGDTYRDLKFTTQYSNVTFKQIMAPIYNGYLSYNNKKFNFVCNGQTGKFSGKYPISPIKIVLFVLSILIVVILIIILIYSFYNS